ncbi:MAG: rhodanese-like domain-containing protein [Acidimicrobiia bacterium]
MFEVIERNELKALMDKNEAQLVDVLPAPEFEELHLPGAINIPLKKLTREAASGLRRDRPVVVY